MGNETGISWTESTWNPVIGCSRVSAGCQSCYAETMAARFSGEGEYYEGVAIKEPGKPGRWTGMVKMVGHKLDQPLRWKRPRRIFVNSMSDLFHDELTNEQIAAIFGVMGLAHWQGFQTLTKRPQRMLDWFAWLEAMAEKFKEIYPNDPVEWRRSEVLKRAARRAGVSTRCIRDPDAPSEFQWPLRNVHIGVTAEDQKAFDTRVPLLMEVPANVRWVSVEPMIGPVVAGFHFGKPRPDWIVIGAESGRGAREMDLEWARSLKDECHRHDVAVFMKQLSGPGGRAIKDPALFPDDLRVQEFPGDRIPF